MSEAVACRNLPILLSVIRQQAGEGVLVAEQDDSVRRFYFHQGELVFIRSEAEVEQFGTYLLGQGLLDPSVFSELQADNELDRVTEGVLQWGMMTLEARDQHLLCLLEQILIHALGHPVLRWTWSAEAMELRLGQEFHFALQHRPFIWRTFQACAELEGLVQVLGTETAWKWEGRRDLLQSLSDLPLTPGAAYAISFLAADPITFETFRYLSNLEEGEAARLIATLWGLGALVQSGGKLPSLGIVATPNPPRPEPPKSASPKPEPPRAAPVLPFILPPADSPFGPPKQRVPDRHPRDIDRQPEFIDVDEGVVPSQEPAAFRKAPTAPPPRPHPPVEELPPCGLRPPANPQAEDTPPGGPRPVESHPSFTPPLQTRFIELDPDHKGVPDPPTPQALREAGALLERARRQAKLGRTVEAVLTLEQAVQVLPEGEASFEAWLMLGKLRMPNLAWSARALQALRNAALARSRDAAPWILMGEIHHRAGSESEAVACFRKALELDPSVPIPPGIDLAEPTNAPLPSPRKGFFGGRGGKP